MRLTLAPLLLLLVACNDEPPPRPTVFERCELGDDELPCEEPYQCNLDSICSYTCTQDTDLESAECPKFPGNIAVCRAKKCEFVCSSESVCPPGLVCEGYSCIPDDS